VVNLGEHSDVVYWRLKTEMHVDTCINDVVRELQYLAEKQLVRLEQIVADRFLATITAEARDCGRGNRGRVHTAALIENGGEGR
jgi:hypothetical protein